MKIQDTVIAITGAAQGLGAAMALSLAKRGAQIALIDTNPERLSETEKACEQLGVKAKAYVCNVANEQDVESTFDQIVLDFGQLDGLINNAGILAPGGFLGGEAINSLNNHFEVNVIGLVRLTNAFVDQLKSKPSAAIINVSSVAGLGNMPMLVTYSASKASSDHLVRAWHETYGLPTLPTNCSNNYGPYHFPEKLIPVVILNALSGRPIPVYGAGQNIRDWLYVEDHADALLTVLDRGAVGCSYNIGGENEVRNIDLVRMICALLDEMRPAATPYADQITFVTDRPGHDARYAIDPSRIRDELGWRPSVTVEQGLEKTVQWYLDNESWWRALQTRDGVGQRLGIKA